MVVGVLAAQDGGPAGTAQGVGYEHVLESRALVYEQRLYVGQMSQRVRVQVANGQIVGEDQDHVGGFRRLLLLRRLLPLGRREAAGEDPGYPQPEQRVESHHEYSSSLIQCHHVRIARRRPESTVSISSSFTPKRVPVRFFWSPDLRGLCFLQVKCYTFPRWVSPLPGDRRGARRPARRSRPAPLRTGRHRPATAERRLVSDLLTALPAALLIGVLPGWFWTRCLLSSGDRAEQLVYAIALSITLVPAVALVQTYLFATGVTFAVTVASAAVVFLAGLAAHLLFGPAKGSEEPLSRPPAPPGLPTLAPLAAALALALWMFLGLAPGAWLMIPIGILVLAAGVAYLLLPQERATPAATPGRDVSATARYSLLALVLLLVLARGYLGPVVNGWPFPRGVDRYEHAVMAGMMMREGSPGSFMLSPPGFPLLTAMISRLSGIEPLEV